MAGKKTGFSRKKLLEFAAAIGLPDKVATRVLDEVLAATEPALEWSASSPYQAETRRDVLRSLRRRRRSLTRSD